MKKKHKYVTYNGTVLRYRAEHNDYYCDNGNWSVNFYFGGELYTDPHTFERCNEIISLGESGGSYLTGIRLIPCSEAEWEKSVGIYNPFKHESDFAPKTTMVGRWGSKDLFDGDKVDIEVECFTEALKDSQKNYKYLLLRR